MIKDKNIFIKNIYIHTVNQGISWQYNPEETARGVFRIETNDFTSTTTKEQLFSVDGKR